MIGTLHLFPNAHSAQAKQLRFRVPKLYPIKAYQIVEHMGYFWMIRAEHLLADLQRSQTQRFHSGVPALFKVQKRQGLERSSHIKVGGS